MNSAFVLIKVDQEAVEQESLLQIMKKYKLLNKIVICPSVCLIGPSCLSHCQLKILKCKLFNII